MHIVTAKDQRRAMAFVETRAAATDNVVSITQHRYRGLGGVPEMGDNVTFLATIPAYAVSSVDVSRG